MTDWLSLFGKNYILANKTVSMKNANILYIYLWHNNDIYIYIIYMDRPKHTYNHYIHLYYELKWWLQYHKRNTYFYSKYNIHTCRQFKHSIILLQPPKFQHQLKTNHTLCLQLSSIIQLQLFCLLIQLSDIFQIQPPTHDKLQQTYYGNMRNWSRVIYQLTRVLAISGSQAQLYI